MAKVSEVPELSDLIVDWDPETLERRPVRKARILDQLGRDVARRARRVVERLPEASLVPGGERFVDATAADAMLLRSHLELQRLHEEFRVAMTMRTWLAPMLDAIRASTTERPLRVVDVGSGLGFVLRALAASRALGDDVELVGVDYNAALVHAADKLARAENLRCSFVRGNAFKLSHPAHVYVSTGVLHHFRGDALRRVFAEHERSPALAFVHLDIRPSAIAPLGSWIFHAARMREPLAQHDGYWSAVRAHAASTLRSAIHGGAPSFGLSLADANPGWRMIYRIFQAAIGARAPLRDAVMSAYASLATRMEASKAP